MPNLFSVLNQIERLPRLHGAVPSAALDKSVSRYQIDDLENHNTWRLELQHFLVVGYFAAASGNFLFD